MLEEVRHPLLKEARTSPALLSDLAGLEKYVAESYDARSFVELLQNADDAGASRFSIRRAGDFLLVANDGHPLTRADFESLCRSAASSKERGTSIGYRGIGFKSVVGFAETVHVFSGQLEATFSRKLTAKEIPEATRVPLIRIPHAVEASQRRKLANPLNQLVQEGFQTVFAFTDLVASGIEAEFAAFDPTSLLFLRNIRQVELRSIVEEVITARREAVSNGVSFVRLASSTGVSSWMIIERNEVALAFQASEKGVERLAEASAVVHAFLPTHEKTGLAIKINGDISTDPSRTRVVLDERTASGIQRVAELICDVVSESIGEGSSAQRPDVVAALVPYSDPRTASFQRRSFKTDLFAAVQNVAKSRFGHLRYRPTWLNPVDFERLAAASEIRAVSREFENIEGLPAFLKFLGANEATPKELLNSLEAVVPSTPGAAEVVAQISKLQATKQMSLDEIKPEWHLWPVDDTPLSIVEARESAAPLDRSFVDMVTEKLGVSDGLKRLVQDLTDSSAAGTMLPSGSQAPALQGSEPTVPTQQHRGGGSSVAPQPQRLSLQRWRSAEQQVYELLRLQGWNVEDVSRQNVGYDIEGVTPEGDEAFIEVKAIKHAGQAFTLTSNEEAVARQKGGSYRLAVVRQSGAYLEVAFIEDPANRLALTRQCRQWVWECASYDYTPERFLLD